MDGDTELSGCVIRAAVEVHRELGPGLQESAYRTCLVHELRAREHRVATEVPLSFFYRGLTLECGYRMDLAVEERLIVELKSVQTLDPLHTALLTYLRLSRKTVGLLINFNVLRLKQGIRRLVLTSASSP